MPGLRVTIDRVVFRRDPESSERPFCFIYFITIHNDSDIAVTIKGRKWVVRADDGEIIAVEAEGVVQQTPLIHPGSVFSYNSYHRLRTRTAVAEGAFLGIDADGRSVFTRIPRFEMLVPDEE